MFNSNQVEPAPRLKLSVRGEGILQEHAVQSGLYFFIDVTPTKALFTEISDKFIDTAVTKGWGIDIPDGYDGTRPLKLIYHLLKRSQKADANHSFEWRTNTLSAQEFTAATVMPVGGKKPYLMHSHTDAIEGCRVLMICA